MNNESWLTHAFNLIRFFFGHLKGKIQVFALIGPSGTGKSFRARLVADRYNIRFIIDDGILIKDKKIIAGRSAKRESAYLAAVKTAIFADHVHRHEVRNALARYRCHRLLILATSDRMILKICQALDLGQPVKIMNIAEIASREEIKKAVENRKQYGRHVIPVPAKEVRRTSAHIVTDEIKLWSSQGFLRTDRIYEKTLVRPEFSTGESLEVSDNLLKQGIRAVLEAYLPGSRLAWFKSQFDSGYSLELTIVLGDESVTEHPFAHYVEEARQEVLSRGAEIHPHKQKFPDPHQVEDLTRLLSSHLEKQTGVKIKQCHIIMKEQRHRKK